MKQHITKKQWNELNESRRGKWFAFIGDRFATFPETLYECGECGVPCLPSVGQMIEFLSVSDGGGRGSHGLCLDLDIINGKIAGNNYLMGETLSTAIATEFCDALWEACKKVLEGVK